MGGRKINKKKVGRKLLKWLFGSGERKLEGTGVFLLGPPKLNFSKLWRL